MGTPGAGLQGLPIDYLESYPLPAFVVRVRAHHEQNTTFARPGLRTRDTDATIRRFKGMRPASNGATTESSESSVTVTRNRSPEPRRSMSGSSVGTTSGSERANGERLRSTRGSTESVPTTDTTDLTDTTTITSLSTSSSASISTSTSLSTASSDSASTSTRCSDPVPDPLDDAHRSYVHTNIVNVGPVSAPLSGPLHLVWANGPALAITHNKPLANVVEPHTLAALQDWAEENSVTTSTTVSGPPSTFALKIGYPPVTLELVKTRLPSAGVGYGSSTADVDSVVLTTTKVTTLEETETPKFSAAYGGQFGPTVRIGPRFLAPQDRPSLPSAILPARNKIRNGPRYPDFSVSEETDGQKLPVAPQCHLLLEQVDWSQTPIGPPSSWPPEIRSMVNLAFSSFTQDCVYIGPEMYMVYNQNYSLLVDHPKSFGRPVSEVWAALYGDLEPILKGVLDGEPVHHEDDCILHQRNDRGRYVEWYHTYSLIPILGSDDKVVGIYNTSYTTTERVLAKRRLTTVCELVEQVSNSRCQDEMWFSVAEVLESNPADAPFVICYSVDEKDNVSTDSKVAVELKLKTTVGVPDGHPCAPKSLHYMVPNPVGSSHASTAASHERRPGFVRAPGSASPATSPGLRGATHVDGADPFDRRFGKATNALSSVPIAAQQFHPSAASYPSSVPKRSFHLDKASTAWPIQRALVSRQCVVVENCSELVKGLPIRQWDDLPDMAIVVPLCPESSEQLPLGVMIIGLNLYRPLDAEYEDWIQVVRGHLSTALASAIAFEEDVARQLEKEKLERAKMTWFRGSAREFHTPLTLISGPLEDLQQTQLTPAQHAQLSMALKHVHRLRQLVASLLNFSRMEAGHVQAHFLPTDISQLVVDIASMFRPSIERLKLEFRVHVHQPVRNNAIGPTSPPMFGVDPVLLEMLLSNMLLIALKMTKRGIVTLELKYERDCAVIVVTDSGSGIRTDVLEFAAEWLGRLNQTPTPATTEIESVVDGMGIGIALSREIVRLHGGTIQIKSTSMAEDPLHHGSAITAHIPLAQPIEEEPVLPPPRGAYARQVAEEIMLWSDDDKSAGSGTSSRSGASGSTGPLPRYGENDPLVKSLMFERSDRLLVLDSNRDVREYLKSIFEPFCKVMVAGSIADAMKYFDTTPPDLVLADEDIVDGTGIELLSVIRALPKAKIPPVVLLSSAAEDESRVDSFIAGADDFITKPFKSRELLLRVHLHMQMGKKRAKLEELFAAREQEIATLSDYCPSGIMRTDAEGSVTYANVAFLEPAGMSGHEDLDQWYTFCDPESWADIEHKWQRVIYGDETTTEMKWKWRTGRTMSGVFIRLDKVNPGLRGIIGCVTDISYQEEKLVEAEQRRKEAEESKHQQELLVDLISHEIRTPVSAILQCSSLVKENLVALKDQLRFAGDSGFRASTQLLSELEEDVGALESIFQCGLVQERIAGDVLSFARIQLNMLSMHEVEMDLRREARKILSLFASEARMKKIDIKLVFGSTLDKLHIHAIKTDPVRLGQVITNLISNAIRFTAASEVRKITITYNVGYDPPPPGGYCYVGNSKPSTGPGTPAPMPDDTPMYLFVSVRDTGPGMNASEKAVLFQRFHQGNKMLHTRYGGSGLGLFICKEITELLGGGIEVQSEPGKGSVFNFYIKSRTAFPSVSPGPNMPELSSVSSNSTSFSVPTRHSVSRHDSETSARQLVTPAMSPDNNVIPLSSPSASLSSLAASSASMLALKSSASSTDDAEVQPALHVLIVEDNIINQTVLKRQILKAGLTCDVANHGGEALSKIHEAHRHAKLGDHRALYDVILMDLEMPVMDGLTALARIREAEADGIFTKQLVIALTGNARQGQIDQALKAGMNDVVIKPYRLVDLIAKMEQMVKQNRASPEPVSD